MLLNLKRMWRTELSTIGVLDVDGENPIYTLERNEVIIPAGTYPVELTFSPRFQRLLPLLDNTEPRTDIRIHQGNYPRDTDGCLLVGLQKAPDMIVKSVAALDPLVTQIQQALDAGDEVTISIS